MILPGLCLAIALLLVAVHQRYAWGYIRSIERETSRFPLFAARDQLVLLIVRGEMKEDGLAWKALYMSVNHLLNLERRLDLIDLLNGQVNHAKRMETDPKYRDCVNGITAAFEAGRLQSAGYANALKDVEEGIQHLVWQRTGAVLQALLIVGVVLAILYVAVRHLSLKLVSPLVRFVFHTKASDALSLQGGAGLDMPSLQPAGC